MKDMYEPNNILITGGAGFIASHVTNYLARLYENYKIYVLDKLDYCSSLQNLENVIDRITFIRGDIQSIDLVLHILTTNNIDTVMHFAAQTHVDNSFGNSIEFTINNTLGTHMLLEACRKCDTMKRFIYVSTDEVYGETSMGKEVGLNEHSLMEPTNPYSAAKAGAEMMCKAYYNSYKLPIIVTRGNNVYGPRQFPEKLVPKMILLSCLDKPLTIHGDGKSKRSYLYIDDVVTAFDMILHKGQIGETYNIGSDDEINVTDVVTDIANMMGCDLNNITYVEDRLFNDKRYYITSSKLKSLGWNKKMTWEEGLKKTKQWYLSLSMNELTKYWEGDVYKALNLQSDLQSKPC